MTSATIANATGHAGGPPAQRAAPCMSGQAAMIPKTIGEHEAEAAVRRTLDVLLSCQVFMCHCAILV